jgi:hypothetical protein
LPNRFQPPGKATCVTSVGLAPILDGGGCAARKFISHFILLVPRMAANMPPLDIAVLQLGADHLDAR